MKSAPLTAEQYSKLYYRKLSHYIGFESTSRSHDFPEREIRARNLNLMQLLLEFIRIFSRVYKLLGQRHLARSTFVFYDSNRASASIVENIVRLYDPANVHIVSVDLIFPAGARNNYDIISFLFFVALRSRDIKSFFRLLFYLASGLKARVASVICEVLIRNTLSHDSRFYFMSANSVLTDHLKIGFARLGFPTFEIMHAVGSRPGLHMYRRLSLETDDRLLFIAPYPKSFCPLAYKRLNCLSKYLNLALAFQGLSGCINDPPPIDYEIVQSIISESEFLAGPVISLSSQAGFNLDSELSLVELEFKIIYDLFERFAHIGYTPTFLISRHPNAYLPVSDYRKLLSGRLKIESSILLVDRVLQGIVVSDMFIAFDSSTAWDALLSSVPAAIFQDGLDDSLYDLETLASLIHPQSLSSPEAYISFISQITDASVASFCNRSSLNQSLKSLLSSRSELVQSVFHGESF
jgi:hypothetical protein